MNKDFSQVTALVVGDLMLDIYIYDNKNKKSPEADIPLVLEEDSNYYAGGSGNVVMNIKSMGGNPIPIGVIGKDCSAYRLKKIFEDSGIDTSNIIKSKESHTTTKKRIFINGEQYLRLDNDQKTINKKISNALYQLVKIYISRCNILILSDYEKGVLTADMCKKIIQLARKQKIPVIIDPKKEKIDCYAGAYVVTPNFKEAKKMSGLYNKKDIIEFFKKHIEKNDITYVLLKNGSEGMTLISKDYSKDFTALKVDSPDVTGAGDTVVSTLSLLISAGNEIEDCVKYSNIAAGLVVSKNETASIEIDEVFCERSINE